VMRAATRTRFFYRSCGALSVGAAAACADVTSSSSVPASIEFNGFAAPAVVIGDTLRDITGRAVPVLAVVRNQQGDVIEDAVVRYTYADATRDSALLVDSLRGFVVARKALSGSGTTARIAARIGGNLQVIRTLLVTLRPDSVDRLDATAIDTLRVTPPDVGLTPKSNTSSALTVTVRHRGDTAVSRVPNWLVRYELLRPANSTNDSTKGAFLVNDQDKLSNIDTTDNSGSTSRFVRVRPSLFPTGAAVDSAVVLVTVTYKGQAVKGAPIRVVVPVIKKP